MPNRRTASAPGKILLAGEYAVLYGGIGVVMAVNRCALASRATTPQHLSPFLAAIRDQMIRSHGATSEPAAIAEHLQVDSRALQGPGGIKYGLGSSAAATVAAATLCLDNTNSNTREDIHRLARLAHAHAQMQRGVRGSGLDIASSVYGGVIAAQTANQERPSELPAVTQLQHAHQVQWVAVWTGIAADTVALVQQVEDARTRDKTTYERHCTEIADIASQLAKALADEHPSHGPRIIDIIAAGNEAIDRFGKSTGVPLCMAAHRDIATLANRYGGAAKPTGAGAGDIAIAALPTPASAQQFCQDIQSTGLQIVDLHMDRDGATRAP